MYIIQETNMCVALYFLGSQRKLPQSSVFELRVERTEGISWA